MTDSATTDGGTTDTAAVVTEQLAEAIRAADGRGQDVDAQARDALGETAAVLGEGGAPAQLAGAAVATLGERAAELLREDPWAVLGVPGVLPANADAFARGLLGPAAAPGDERRVGALVQWLLERAALHGHTAVELAEIRAGLAREGVPDPDDALLGVVTDGRVMTFTEEGEDEGDDDAEDVPVGRVLLALDRFALAEESLADGLVRLVSTFPGREAAAGGSAWVPEGEAEGGAFGDDAFGPGGSAGGPGNPGADEPGSDGPEAGEAKEVGEAGEKTAAGAAHLVADTDAMEAAGIAGEAQGPGAGLGGEDGPRATAAGDGTDEGSASAPGGAARRGWEEVAAEAPNSSAAALIRAVADASLVLHTGGETARNEPVALLRAARAVGLRAALAAAHADSADRLRAVAGNAEASAPGAGAEAGADAQGGHPALPDAPLAQPLAQPLAELLATTPHDADGTLALDLLIVCDASALDVEAAATLVESLADGARLVFSGDPGELWSPGPGRVFADLLAAKPGPVVASRQPDFGPIGELVSGIGIGEFEPVAAPDKEVVLVQARDGAEAVHRTVQLVADSIPRALGIPTEQVRVLTPVHAGPAGTRALNAALKARLNPGPGQFGGFDAGDAVVHAPTPSTLREGVVRRAVPEGLEIAFHGGTGRAGGTGAAGETDGTDETAVVTRERIGELRHGWALTAHQAVGRRWPGVVVVATPDAGPELTRQWLYTACGRAERHLSLVSGMAPAALQQNVSAQVARPRTTRLRTILAGG